MSLKLAPHIKDFKRKNIVLKVVQNAENPSISNCLTIPQSLPRVHSNVTSNYIDFFVILNVLKLRKSSRI